jgi:hypothetical protein
MDHIDKIEVTEPEETTLISTECRQSIKIGSDNIEEKVRKLIILMGKLGEKSYTVSRIDLRFREEAAVMFR